MHRKKVGEVYGRGASYGSCRGFANVGMITFYKARISSICQRILSDVGGCQKSRHALISSL